MKIEQTEFNDLLILNPQVFKDDRGEFYESWRQLDYKQLGIKETFLQDNVSKSHKNVLRGMHWQKDQGQLVTVVYGKIYDVVIDLRKNSPTYKKHASIELDDDRSLQLYIPPGFAHGFCVLSDFAIINYKCTQYYNNQTEGTILWNDPEFNIKWPIDSPIISNKDKQGQSYNDYEKSISS